MQRPVLPGITVSRGSAVSRPGGTQGRRCRMCQHPGSSPRPSKRGPRRARLLIRRGLQPALRLGPAGSRRVLRAGWRVQQRPRLQAQQAARRHPRVLPPLRVPQLLSLLPRQNRTARALPQRGSHEGASGAEQDMKRKERPGSAAAAADAVSAAAWWGWGRARPSKRGPRRARLLIRRGLQPALRLGPAGPRRVLRATTGPRLQAQQAAREVLPPVTELLSLLPRQNRTDGRCRAKARGGVRCHIT